MVLDKELISAIAKALKSKCSPRHVPDEVIQVTDIPYTISGKKMEAPVKKILMGMEADSALNKDAMRNPESLQFLSCLKCLRMKVSRTLHLRDHRSCLIMKTIISLWLSLWVLGPITAQPFNIGHRQLTFIDADRNDRPILTELYYPSATTGDNVPVSDVGGETYPVVAFGHGFVMEWSAYANIWNALVPEGYIIAFPRTETGISPDHLTFARDLAFIIRAIQEEGKTVGSPFLVGWTAHHV